MIDTKTSPQADEATVLDAAPSLGPAWFEDETAESPPLSFWQQVHRGRVRRTYEEIQGAWALFDDLCLQQAITGNADRQACAGVRRSLHQALDRLRIASSIPLT